MKTDKDSHWISSTEEIRTDSTSNNHPQSKEITLSDSIDMDPTVFWKVAKLGRIGSSRLRMDDDFADRMNYQFSGAVLFAMISVTGVRQYFGKPIQCWIPPEFTRGWEEYAESFCWVSDTYFNPISKRLIRIPNKDEVRISYYQWATIMLAIQALLFYIPCLLWRLLILQSEFNVRRIIQIAKDSNLMMPDHIHKSVKFIAKHMDKCFSRKKIYGTGLKANIRRILSCMKGGFCGRNSGKYLVFLYVFIKFLYLLNVFGQLYLMQRFIGTSNILYGVQVLYDLLKGNEWINSGHFPRVTFCDIEAKKLGKNHLYTIQCVLPLNMFLEKIFIFLWFWHTIVGLITLVSLLTWLSKLCSRRNQLNFIKDYLKFMDIFKYSDSSLTRTFVFDYMRLDGVFIIHLLSINVGDIIAGDVVYELWVLFRNQRPLKYEKTKIDDDVAVSPFKFTNKEIAIDTHDKDDIHDDIV